MTLARIPAPELTPGDVLWASPYQSSPSETVVAVVNHDLIYVTTNLTLELHATPLAFPADALVWVSVGNDDHRTKGA